MKPLSDLARNDLIRAHYACDMLVFFRDYLPDGPLYSLIGQFMNAVDDAIPCEYRPLPRRAGERKPVGELGIGRRENIARAVRILLRHFSPYMDDELPKLLAEFSEELNRQKEKRAEIPASAGAS